MLEITPTDKRLLSMQSLCLIGNLQAIPLLDNISATILAGDSIALTGDSGAGKSLLLRSMALLEKIPPGKILWQGKAVQAMHIPHYRSRVIYLQQRPALGNGTVIDCLQQVFKLKVHHGKTFSVNQINRYLSQLGLENSFLNKNLQTLSGGEAQITALLRAMQLQPEILLLDEPTAALDADKALAVENMVANWLKAEASPRAFIWITHDPAQAARVAKKHWSMTQGKLTEMIAS